MAVSLYKNIKIKEQLYGQLIIGPPGSGKTTYCEKASKFYTEIGRNVQVVNLDPGNDFNWHYKPDIDIMELINVQDVMEYHNLGPNGALLFCMEYLEENLDWLTDKLEKSKCSYFLFDCPGQVELYTCHKSMSNILEKLNQMGYNFCIVNLIDSHYCSSASKFISTLVLSLTTMLKMAQPHVNVLSKADLFKKYESTLPFNLDYYTDVLELTHLLEILDDDNAIGSKHLKKKYAKLNSALISMIEDYGLVTFQPLDINKTNSFLRLKNLIDKANGYIFSAGEEKSINTLLACAVGAETENERMSKDIDPYVL